LVWLDVGEILPLGAQEDRGKVDDVGALIQEHGFHCRDFDLIIRFLVLAIEVAAAE